MIKRKGRELYVEDEGGKMTKVTAPYVNEQNHNAVWVATAIGLTCIYKRT